MEITLIQKITVWALPVLFAISIHEVAHGWVALYFGDQTARFSGRLSFNPLKHIDPIGTVAVPLLMLAVSNFIFGWAKPVPVDPRNFKHPKRDMAFVALAGPLANLIMALAWGAIAKAGMIAEAKDYAWIGVPLIYMGDAGIMINIVLGVLNLIPLPPLDGSKILVGLLPKRMAYYVDLIEPYGFFILIALMFSGLLSFIMGPPVIFLMSMIEHLFGIG